MIPPPPSSTLFPYTTLFRSPPAIAVGTVDVSLHLTGSPSRETDYRSEEHTSELQSRGHLVCRLLLEKKKKKKKKHNNQIKKTQLSDRLLRSFTLNTSLRAVD